MDAEIFKENELNHLKEIGDNYANRYRRATSLFPKEKNIYKRVKYYEELLGLDKMKGPPQLVTSDKSIFEGLKRPCLNKFECNGEMIANKVCKSCGDWQQGYRTKWTCQKCGIGVLSKKSGEEWKESLK